MGSKNSLLFTEERRINILEILNKQRKISVSELSDTFQVSGATVRSDLRDLQKSGKLTRTHGGAIVRVQTGFEPVSREKKVKNFLKKQIIAKKALDMIQEGDRIILDTGTTTLGLAKLLYQKNNITVLTNDILIAGILEEFNSIDLFLIGGFVRKNFHCSILTSESSFLSSLTVDKAFMGVNSFSIEKGATTPNIEQANTKKAFISIANKVFLLCDSSKIGNVSFARFADNEEIDTLITDEMVQENKKIFEENGIEVL